MNKFLLILCMLAIGVVVFFGLFLFVKGLRNIQMGVASTKWPTVAGVVVSSRTTRNVSRDDRRHPPAVTYDTKTVIQYSVNGQNFTTDVLHFGQTLGSGDNSEAALQRLRFPSGKPVTVSYNPASPATAVMKPGLHASAFWLPGAGLAFLLPAALCLILGPIRFMPPPSLRRGDAGMSLAATGFAALFCGLGVLALTAGLQHAWHGLASEHWPITQGVVVMAGKTTGDDAEETTYDPGSHRYARFVYRYSVAGIEHFNNVRQFARVEDGDAEEIERLQTRYAKGTSVKVSYFPTDPDIAVLEPGNTGNALILPGVGVVVILFSLAIFIWIVPSMAR